MVVGNYGKNVGIYGLWDGVDISDSYFYQLLICDQFFFSGFFVFGYMNNCYKVCNNWCGDRFLLFFCIVLNYGGVLFNINGYDYMNNRFISVGLCQIVLSFLN